MEYKKVIETIFDEINKNKENIIQTTTQLVKIPSVVGEETEAQRFMASKFKDLGLKVESFEADLDEIKKHPAYIDIPYEYKNRPNVIGTLEGSEESPSLILNGHVDVVSPEPISSWTFDPWGGEVENGKIYGRGVVDMKGGVIANLFAVKAILDSGFRPKGNLIMESVIEEEAGGSGGTLACFMKGYTADGMLIPEPSSLQVVVCHTGVKYFRVKVYGKTAHAALSHTGINAIGKMNKIYEALVALDENRASAHPYPLIEKYSGRSCNLNIGTYTAGDWASSVAGMAQLECRVGFVPGEKGDDIVKEVENTIKNVAQNDEWLKDNPPIVEWYGWDTDPWLQDENDNFIQAFLQSSQDVLGKKPEIVAFPGGLDTRFSPYFDVPSFTYGPTGGSFHGPDEYLEINSLIELTRIIAKFVIDWCGYE